VLVAPETVVLSEMVLTTKVGPEDRMLLDIFSASITLCESAVPKVTVHVPSATPSICTGTPSVLFFGNTILDTEFVVPLETSTARQTLFPATAGVSDTDMGTTISFTGATFGNM
jgi:hypothetical protein